MEYVELGEYGKKIMEFWESENSPQRKLSSESIEILKTINKTFNNSENKADRDKNIRSNLLNLAKFYVSLFREEKDGKVIQKQIIIDPDEIRKLFAPYGYDKTNVVEFYDLSGELNDKVFELVKEQMKAIGEKNIVFVTGAPASGKSMALGTEEIAEMIKLDSYAVVYDSQMRDFDYFSGKFANPLLNDGFEIGYIQVYNDPYTTFQNMLKRGIDDGRFLPCHTFLSGLFAQRDRAEDIEIRYKDTKNFTYYGVDNSNNETKKEIVSLKEAITLFDYNITINLIDKFLTYGRELLRQESERTERTRSIRGTRQNVSRRSWVSGDNADGRNNEATIANVLRGLLYVKVALHVQYRKGFLHDAGTLENPMDRVGTQGNEKTWDFPILKEIEADIVKLKHKKDKSEQEHEILELVYLAEQIADHHLANPEKYLPPHYKDMLRTSLDEGKELREGEFIKSERIFSLKGRDFVMGSEKITGPDKVAEMFRNLEEYGVENTFAVYIPNGTDGQEKAIVQYLSTGATNASFANPDAIIQGALKCDAKEVYFVHNHPSGNVRPSDVDYKLYANLSVALSKYGIELKEGVILNTNTGKYGVFSIQNGKESEVLEFSPQQDKLKPYEVLEFSKTVFNKDYKPEEDFIINNSKSVAEFLSRMRFGEGNKIGYMILNQRGGVMANLFLEQTEITRKNEKEIAKEISKNAILYSGSAVIIYGRFDADWNIQMKKHIDDASSFCVKLHDIVKFTSTDNKNYISFADKSLLNDKETKYIAMDKKNKSNNNSGYERYQYSFSELKDKISLKEFLIHLGYRPVAGKCCATSAEFKHPDGRESVILKYRMGQTTGEGYFTRNGEKGDITNFVKNRISDGSIMNPVSVSNKAYSNTMYCVNVVLHNYLNIPPEVKERNQEAIKAVLKREPRKLTAEDLNFENKIMPLENHQFLFSRKIWTAEIKDPMFKGRIFNEKEKPMNIVFPMYDANDNVIGLEARNRNFKHQFAGSNGGEGVWHSNIPDKIQKVFIAESPLDCIAHRALRGNENTLYFSFNGALSWDQVKTINNILDKNRDKVDVKNFSFALGSDNDGAGTSYDVMFLTRQMKQRFKGECTVIHQENLRKEISLEMGKFAPELSSKISAYVKANSSDDSIKVSMVNSTVKINYPDKDFFSERNVCSAILSTKVLPFTKLEKSQFNDWNDDLIVCRENKVKHQFLCDHKETFISDVDKFQKEAEKSVKKSIGKGL